MPACECRVCSASRAMVSIPAEFSAAEVGSVNSGARCAALNIPASPTQRMTPEELRSQVATIKWHHSIDLGHGIVTPGQDNSAKKLQRLQLPASFAGKSVLDIG